MYRLEDDYGMTIEREIETLEEAKKSAPRYLDPDTSDDGEVVHVVRVHCCKEDEIVASLRCHKRVEWEL